MSDCPNHHYEDGPTTCAPTQRVIRSIQKQIRAAGAVSRADVRMATAMGLVSADSIRPPGFNDELIAPPMAVMRELGIRARALRAPRRRRTLHAIALLVDFSDNKGSRSPAEFKRLLFDTRNSRSMTSYYRDLSKGALRVTGEVTRWIRAPRPYRFYTAGQSGTGLSYPQNTPGLLFDALTEFTRIDDLRRFDLDGDGLVDGIFLIHAGGGAEAEPDPAKRAEMIWSHKWVLPRPFVEDGVSVFAYSTEPEDGRVGVFCHEFGHVLGLPDLYDTTYRSRGIGDWCLMAGGSWGGGGNQPVRMSAWCLARLEWITPRRITRARTVTMATLARRKTACYRLWTDGAEGAESFLIENRQATGMDAALPASGLAVWHVDEQQSGNTNPLSFLVGLVQADGRRDLELNRNSGDPGDLFPGARDVTALDDGTTPSTRANDGRPSEVALSGIAETGGKIRLKVRVSAAPARPTRARRARRRGRR
jgi:immune inhibitor A